MIRFKNTHFYEFYDKVMWFCFSNKNQTVVITDYNCAPWNCSWFFLCYCVLGPKMNVLIIGQWCSRSHVAKIDLQDILLPCWKDLVKTFSSNMKLNYSPLQIENNLPVWHIIFWNKILIFSNFTKKFFFYKL